jgi:hypothetical protein
MNWLRVLCPAEMPHVDQGVGHQFHRVVALLDVLKPQQLPLESHLQGAILKSH